MFAEINTTNLRKSFYKKRDLTTGIMNEPVTEGGEGAATGQAEEPIYDSHGEELMAHTSKNTMNEMILANAKNANVSTLGKRARSEAGQDTDGQEIAPQKRRKNQPGSYGAYLSGKDLSQKAEEMLNSFRVQPGHTFAELGGMADTIK